MTVSDAIRQLEESIESLRCEKLVRLLKGLGFAVRKGSRGNHWVYSHRELENFHGSNFDCGHGRNRVIKPVYVRKVIKTLTKYREELENLRGEPRE